jgi:hypothetical protein
MIPSLLHAVSDSGLKKEGAKGNLEERRPGKKEHSRKEHQRKGSRKHLGKEGRWD